VIAPETDDAHFEAIFDALVSEPNPAAVTGSKDIGGPSEYSFVIDAEDAPEAAMRAVALSVLL
jgi:hypothetical protein